MANSISWGMSYMSSSSKSMEFQTAKDAEVAAQLLSQREFGHSNLLAAGLGVASVPFLTRFRELTKEGVAKKLKVVQKDLITLGAKQYFYLKNPNDSWVLRNIEDPPDLSYYDGELSAGYLNFYVMLKVCAGCGVSFTTVLSPFTPLTDQQIKSSYTRLGSYWYPPTEWNLKWGSVVVQRSAGPVSNPNGTLGSMAGLCVVCEANPPGCPECDRRLEKEVLDYDFLFSIKNEGRCEPCVKSGLLHFQPPKPTIADITALRGRMIKLD